MKTTFYALILICFLMAAWLDGRAIYKQWLVKEGKELRIENKRLLDENYEVRHRHAELWKEKNMWVAESSRLKNMRNNNVKQND